jgi:threonine aldolase
LGSKAQQLYPITKMLGIAAQPTEVLTSALGRNRSHWKIDMAQDLESSIDDEKMVFFHRPRTTDTNQF